VGIAKYEVSKKTSFCCREEYMFVALFVMIMHLVHRNTLRNGDSMVPLI